MSIGSVRARVTALFKDQIRLARHNGVEANVTALGDGIAKQIFYTLLPGFAQRRVFIDVLSDATAYPRVRTLFGAPPYSFLKDEDAQMLCAAGFAHSRQNMSYGSMGRNAAPPYSQFGIPHLRDQYDREYTICSHRAFDSMTLGAACLLGEGGPVPLFIRIKRADAQTRIKMEKSVESRQELIFPTNGENLLLRPSLEVLKQLNKVGEQQTLARHVRVLGVQFPTKRASTTSLTVLVHNTN